jgi:hypothetical protein
MNDYYEQLQEALVLLERTAFYLPENGLKDEVTTFLESFE